MGKLDTVTVNGPEDEISDWDAVDWRRVEDDVRRLPRRIFTATQAGDLKRVRNLQKLIIHTHTAEAVAQTASACTGILLSRPRSLRGLLEPVAWKAGMAGSEQPMRKKSSGRFCGRGHGVSAPLVRRS